MASVPAGNAVLTDKEASMFATLYGDVRVDEGIHTRLAKLFLTSMAPGTVRFCAFYWRGSSPSHHKMF